MGTMSMLVLDKDKCDPNRCKYECISACIVSKRSSDHKAITKNNGRPSIDSIYCTNCNRCVEGCPLEAIRVTESDPELIRQYVDLENWTELPYLIHYNNFSPFSEADTIFGRVMNDPSFAAYHKGIYLNQEQIFAEQRSGYSRREAALASAAWDLYDSYKGAFSWGESEISPDMKFDAELVESTKNRPLRKDPQRDALMIKRAAKEFGAVLVGIAPVHREWIYTHNRKGEVVDFPETMNSVIVMAIEMNLKALQTSPAYPASIATGNGYSRMAFVQACMASFIRNLGYTAIPAGNNVGLSVPIAIEAGLGEFGRHGLLVTEKYGSNVRLCKVYTDMDLEKDQPVNFGVLEFCRTCKRCAEACPSQSISHDDLPSWDGPTRSNNGGILKWYVNVESCYEFWVKNGNECSNCLVSCPFTKNLHWTHRIPRFFIKHFPRFNRLWVKLDHLLGYGKQRDPQSFRDDRL